MSVLDVASVILGYGAVGVYAFARLCRQIRSSKELQDWELLLGLQFARAGFIIATLLVFAWPIWWTLPAVGVRCYRWFRA